MLLRREMGYFLAGVLNAFTAAATAGGGFSFGAGGGGFSFGAG